MDTKPSLPDTLYESVISDLKGVIGSNKDGVPLNEINSEYEFITRSSLPLKDLGYTSVREFIKSVPHLFKIEYVGNSMRVFNVISANESESNLTLYSLIMNTNPKKPTTRFKSKPFFQPNRMPTLNFGFHSKFNISNGINNHKLYEKSNDRNYVNRQKLELNPLNDANVYVPIDSDTDESIIDISSSIEIQTVQIVYKKIMEFHGSFKPLDFVSTMIDIIIEFKPLNLDKIVFFKIGTNLYHYFNVLTGLNVDPCMFPDLVLNVLSSSKCREWYGDLIYTDDSNKYCCLNLFATNYTIVHLPLLEFNTITTYSVEIISVSPSGIVAAKFSEKSSELLKFNKSRTLSEDTRNLIENRHFWSWIPGSLCLVQLPYAIVKSLNIEPVERAIILSTEIAQPIDVSMQKCSSSILHLTSFYLIDHNISVPNIMACKSSFQIVKQSAYRNNETNIAYVCNASIRARSTPSKIQFFKIKNINDVSQVFLDSTGKFQSNKSLIVFQISHSHMMKNFQPVYKCYARIDSKEFEDQRRVLHYDNGTEPSINNKVDIITDNEEIEVIVISDSEDDNYIPGKDSRKTIKSSDKGYICKNANLVKEIPHGILDKIIDVDALPTGGNQSADSISVISYTNDELDESSSVSSFSSKESCNKIESEVTGTPTVDTNKPLGKDLCKEKCIIPITTNLCSKFEGNIVRIMHLQSGAAVVCLLESRALMQQEMRMLSIAHQELTGIIGAISIGDYFLWYPCENVDYIKAYNNIKIALVEILQLVNDNTVLVALVHYGLIITVKRNELVHIPDFNGDIQQYVGPIVGAFDLHMIPKWFNFDIDDKLGSTLFTAFFINDDQLVLEYFDQRCRFLNFDFISNVQETLALNHCNNRSKSFITHLSESLTACRLFVGNLLAYSDKICPDFQLDCLSIANTLTPVSEDDEPDVWFASVDIEAADGEIVKFSPHYFNQEKFCIDRVRYNKTRHSIRLLDYEDIEMEIPTNFEGIFKFNQHLLTEFMKSNSEFYSRYMLIGALQIPDLNYLFNKLMF